MWFLLGIEEHLLAYYDTPELIREISEFVLSFYMTQFIHALEILKPDVVYIMEDLSGVNGPMFSPAFF